MNISCETLQHIQDVSKKNLVKEKSSKKVLDAVSEGAEEATASASVNIDISDVLQQDLIKLTARFTSVNGREFLVEIATRERTNPDFDFLKPSHILFGYGSLSFVESN